MHPSDPARTDSFAVYGRLFPRQGADAGGYADAITAMVVTSPGPVSR
jgi:hypothetical protein